MIDLQLAYEALKEKRTHHDKRIDYYEGRQPLRWSTERLQRVFKETHVFVQNWCSVVIDAAADRMMLERFNVAKNDSLSNRLDELLRSTGLDLDTEDLSRDALVFGESYVLAWKDDEIEAYRQDPRAVHLWMEPEHPRRPRMGAKLFTDDDGLGHMVLYYADRLEYYRTTKKLEDLEAFKEGEWLVDEAAGGVAENPYGVVPLFCLQTNARAASDLDNAIPLQDVVNKTLSDLVTVAEYAAYPQRWMISNTDDQGKLPVDPQSVLQVPAGGPGEQPVSLGSFPAADMGNFTSILDSMSLSMAIITRTPKHFFFAQGGDPSGEALIAMEAPLNKKILRYEKRLGSDWARLAAFLLQLDGTAVEASQIEAVWDDPATIQPVTLAQIRATNVSAGMPLVTILRDEGWSQEEIDQMLQDMNAVPKAGTNQPQELQDQTASNISPMIESAIQAVSDGALDAILKSGALDRVTAARAQAAA